MLRLLAAILVAALGAAPLFAQDPATGGLSLADFEKLYKELQPPDNELWRSIPWHVSILDGREAALKNKKPIFVWVASGEPLGCG